MLKIIDILQILWFNDQVYMHVKLVFVNIYSDYMIINARLKYNAD